MTVEGALHIAADNPRQEFAHLAAAFFAPFPEIAVAVTGTNGKTSTVEMTRQLWRMAGHHAASIGTLGVTTSDDSVSTGLTTPDVVTFLSNVAGLAREGVTHVAFEASSHGLSQYRTEGLKVSAAAFTNLSRDHLDYHGDMANYLTAKLRLFSEVLADDGTAVVWADDPQAARVVDLAHARRQSLITVGERGERAAAGRPRPDLAGAGAGDRGRGREHKVKLPLIGAYQAANALTAAGLVIATGGDVAQTIQNLARLQPVRGRLERAVINRARRAGLCRLRAHPRCAGGGDRRAQAAYRRAADRRVRRGRRPRSRQARVDGGDRRALRRHGDRDRRQSAQRGPRRDPRRGAEGRAGRDRDRRPPRARSARRWRWPGRRTSC